MNAALVWYRKSWLARRAAATFLRHVSHFRISPTTSKFKIGIAVARFLRRWVILYGAVACSVIHYCNVGFNF